MKITGSRWELQIEDDNGNVAGFSGEACPGEFLADAASLCWIRHKGEAAQGDGMDLIRKVTEYTKDSSCRVLFFDADQKILFEDELELKTEAYLSKTYLIFLAAVVVPLAFVAALLTMLDEIERMVRLLTDLVMLLAAMPFLFLMLRVVRLHVAARGAVMTVRPTIGRTYSFPLSEITKVIRKVRPDPMGAPITRASIKKLTICTKARRVVLCESITGIEAIDAYLARHVDPEHIVTKA